MDLSHPTIYEVEVWNAAGARVADISALVSNLHYVITRNDAEQLTFSLDLFAFENYCATALKGLDPKQLIAPDVTDIKLKRNGVYLFGTQVVDVSFDAPQDSSGVGAASGIAPGITINVTASGYLNFFKDRYVTATYLATERTTIATNIITLTQSQLNGSFGVTNSGTQYATGQLSDRTYALDNVKTKLQELAALSDSPFDFSFSPMKVFQTYGKIGARRQDINLIYGGPLGNVAGFALDRSAINLYNLIYGMGSGFGASQLTSTQVDLASQLNFYLRESISQFNSVVLQPTLDANTTTAVALSKDILELPKVTITGNEIPAAFLSVGDRIPLKVMAHKMLDNINGLYRIEQLDVTVDENNFESAIQITFDSYGVNQSE